MLGSIRLQPRSLRYYQQSGPGSRYDGGATFAFPDLVRCAEHGDVRAGEARDRMARYLGRGMRMVVSGLAPERILIIGDLTAAWPRLGPWIETEVRAQALPGGSPPQVVPVDEDGQGRMRGASLWSFRSALARTFPLFSASRPDFVVHSNYLDAF